MWHCGEEQKFSSLVSQRLDSPSLQAETQRFEALAFSAVLDSLRTCNVQIRRWLEAAGSNIQK